MVTVNKIYVVFKGNIHELNKFVQINTNKIDAREILLKINSHFGKNQHSVFQQF